MTLVDANLLIYAFRQELPQHAASRKWLLELPGPLGIPTLCEVAFLRLVTKRLGHLEAAPWSAAWEFLTRLLSRPGVRRIQPGQRHSEIFSRLVIANQITGDSLVDVWIAACALENQATLASVDRGFARFPELNWCNPIPEQQPGLDF
jgi:toxin-antitoxin system PIN domain toxin